LLDPAKISDRGWRIAVTIALSALVCCLGMAAYLATRTTLHLLNYRGPGQRDAVQRAGMRAQCAARHRATMLLYYTYYNAHFSSFKVKNVKNAGLWFRAALAWFVVLALLLMIYVTVGPRPH
jgi:hypothetical protein